MKTGMKTGDEPSLSWLYTLTHDLICVDFPVGLNNPVFQGIFKDRMDFDAVTSGCPLALAPGIGASLGKHEPPPFGFFLSLPSPTRMTWAVYAICTEKAGEQPALYIGSATGSKGGVTARKLTYYIGSRSLPGRVRKIFNQGYHISHMEMLCSATIPSAALLPRQRALFLGLETSLTVAFNAKSRGKNGHLYEHLLPWVGHDAGWVALCSHLPLVESVHADVSMTAEQLQEVAAIRAERVRAQKRAGDFRYRAKKWATAPQEWRALLSARQAVRLRNNPESAKKNADTRRANAKASGRFRCEDCQFSLSSNHAMRVHLAAELHKDRAAGVPQAPPSETCVATALAVAEKVDNGWYRCTTCSKSFGFHRGLKSHLNTALHARVAARTPGAAEQAATDAANAAQAAHAAMVANAARATNVRRGKIPVKPTDTRAKAAEEHANRAAKAIAEKRHFFFSWLVSSPGSCSASSSTLEPNADCRRARPNSSP